MKCVFCEDTGCTICLRRRLRIAERALTIITDRFEEKLSLHKEDCFAFQTARDALEEMDKDAD